MQDKYDQKAVDYKNVLYDADKKGKEIKELQNTIVIAKKEKEDILEKLKVIMSENDKLATLL